MSAPLNFDDAVGAVILAAARHAAEAVTHGLPEALPFYESLSKSDREILVNEAVEVLPSVPTMAGGHVLSPDEQARFSAVRDEFEARTRPPRLPLYDCPVGVQPYEGGLQAVWLSDLYRPAVHATASCLAGASTANPRYAHKQVMAFIRAVDAILSLGIRPARTNDEALAELRRTGATNVMRMA